MPKITDITLHLTTLVRQCQISERSFRSAATRMQAGSEKAIFIHFWQEHARMTCELQEKVRWLGGTLHDEDRPQPWGGLQFRDNATEEEIIGALMQCESDDAELLIDYEYV